MILTDFDPLGREGPFFPGEFPGKNFKIHAAQRRYLELAGTVHFPEIFGQQYRLQHLLPWGNTCLSMVSSVNLRKAALL